jgi:PAS domain S-box-containing protein
MNSIETMGAKKQNTAKVSYIDNHSYFKLFEHSREAFIISGPDGRVINANHAAAIMLGYQLVDEMLGNLSVNAYAYPEQRDVVIIELNQKGFIENYEVELIRQDGSNSHFIALVSAIMVKDNQGRLLRNEAVLTDISELKKLEQLLKESRQQYYLLFSGMLTGCAVHEAIFDNEGKVIDYITLEINRAFENLLNVSGSVVIGARASSLLLQRELSDWLNIFSEVVIKGEPTNYEIYSDFNRKYFEGTAYRIEKNNFVVTFSDITKRKQTETELIESQNYLNAIYQNTNIGLAIGDLNGNFVKINPALSHLLGYTLQEINQLTIAGITFPDDLSNDQALFQEVIEGTRSQYQIEKRYIHKNGSLIWGLASISLIKDKEGRPQFTIGTLEDITERKALTQELISTRDEITNLAAHIEKIREMERTKIAADLHDDLGQQLTALNMDLSWLRTNLINADRPIIGRLASMSAILLKTIETVQFISTELRPGILDDFGLTAAIEWHLEVVRKRTGINHKLSLLPDDSDISPDISILIFRIVQEALTNITRHARASFVHIVLKQENGKLHLIIRDNGRGITKAEIKNPRSFGIIGMKQRVKSFGGTFDIFGRSQNGTTLEITIPKKLVHD